MKWDTVLYFMTQWHAHSSANNRLSFSLWGQARTTSMLGPFSHVCGARWPAQSLNEMLLDPTLSASIPSGFTHLWSHFFLWCSSAITWHQLCGAMPLKLNSQRPWQSVLNPVLTSSPFWVVANSQTWEWRNSAGLHYAPGSCLACGKEDDSCPGKYWGLLSIWTHSFWKGNLPHGQEVTSKYHPLLSSQGSRSTDSFSSSKFLEVGPPSSFIFHTPHLSKPTE